MNIKSLTVLFLLMHITITATVVTIATNNDFETKILASKKPALIAFSSSWCSMCKHITQPFEDVSNEAEFSHILFAHIDIDEHSSISQAHGIIGVPTFVYLENGVKKDQSVGLQDLASFKPTLRTVLRSQSLKSPTNIALHNDAEKIEVVEIQKPAATASTATPVPVTAIDEKTIINAIKETWQQFTTGVMATWQKIRDYFTKK